MPGMMDTVLNLGLNAATTEGLAKLTGDARFAYDSYRRFIQMYSDVVLGVEHAAVRGNPGRREGRQGRRARHRSRCRRSQAHRRRVQARGWKRNWASPSRKTCRNSFGAPSARCSAPGDSPRANTYRKLHNIPEDWGTAVTVQAMVFGNRGETSATGVAFTRDPATGEKLLYGEFLINAQGEDVVAGIRTPQPISKMVRERQGGKKPSMEEAMPKAYRRTQGHRRAAGTALPRHAGRGIHGAGRQALHAADPRRQAHGGSRAEGRGRHGGRRADRPGHGSQPRRSCGAGPAAASHPRSRCAQDRDRRPAWAPRRAPPPAKWCSPRTKPKSSPPITATSSWCAPRPARKTFTACMRPRASSPRAAA